MPDDRSLTALCIDYFDTLASHHHRAPRLGDLLGMPDEFEKVWRAWGDRRMTEHVSFETLLEEVFLCAGRRPEPDVVAHVVAERARRQAQLLLEPDARIIAMLERCRDLGLRVAVVSNAALEDLAAWSDSLLATLVDATAFSWEIGATKPAARIYQAALDRLGTTARQAAFVSDAASDLDGARMAGFRVLLRATWYQPLLGNESSFPTVDDPAALPDTLARFL